jgi:hypothetical protein
MDMNKKAVYTIIDSKDPENKRGFWVRVGAAFTNRDGSYTVKLDALPVNGSLHIREWPARDDLVRNRENGAPPQPSGGHAHADIFAAGP